MSALVIDVGVRLLAGNDLAAEDNAARLRAAGVLAVNLLAGPGAGKTSLIVRTIQALAGRARVGVIEGDLAGSIDAERVLAAGAAGAVQINTAGSCHLEAGMVAAALDALDLASLDLLLIENVGNLVCPTHWRLGTARTVCILGASEGDDKPVKYPAVFASADAVVLNKLDLAPLVDFDRVAFETVLRALNPTAPLFALSCRSGEGIAAWADWLVEQVAADGSPAWIESGLRTEREPVPHA